jgi:hypothetical protein
MKDFLGQEYGPGDQVIYGATSGRCINMVTGTVVKVTDKGDGKFTVQILPEKSSRWTQHDGGHHYIDNRTGKHIKPWGPKYETYVKEHGYYELDGRKLSGDGRRGLLAGDYLRATYHASVFHDWVERIDDPVKPVTITVTENIVKWNPVSE